MKGTKKLKRKEKRELKKERKEQRFSDPYKIADMSDEEFLEVSKKLIWKARFRTIGGIILMVLAIIALFIFWECM